MATDWIRVRASTTTQRVRVGLVEVDADVLYGESCEGVDRGETLKDVPVSEPRPGGAGL